MFKSFRLYVLTAAASVIVTTEIGVAQVLTVVPNYTAAAGGNPATAKPSGTYNLPGGTDSWQVTVDYGTLTSGAFTVWAGSVEDSVKVVQAALPGAGPGPWGPVLLAQNLTNAPANLYVRARLQKKVNNLWVTQATANVTCP